LLLLHGLPHTGYQNQGTNSTKQSLHFFTNLQRITMTGAASLLAASLLGSMAAAQSIDSGSQTFDGQDTTFTFALSPGATSPHYAVLAIPDCANVHILSASNGAGTAVGIHDGVNGLKFSWPSTVVSGSTFFSVTVEGAVQKELISGAM
jgi:hypothetical protein